MPALGFGYMNMKQMILSEGLFDELQDAIREYSGTNGHLTLVGSVSGGSINACYQLGFNSENYFLKLNSSQKLPGMFRAEALALSMIAETGSVACPKVIARGEVGSEQFLLLEWLAKGSNTPTAQRRLAENLALLHRVSNSTYGLDHSNYMGSLVQENGSYSSFAEFFVKKRLMPQVELANSKGLLDKTITGDFERLYARFAAMIPQEPPALVHGDLWAGNYMIAENGDPYLIDPAIAFSHREVDIAMTQLFGGFDRAFYDAYSECFPLERDWESRTSLWNLYPLLIHLNLFGFGYLGEVKRSLKQWV